MGCLPETLAFQQERADPKLNTTKEFIPRLHLYTIKAMHCTAIKGMLSISKSKLR